MCVCVCDAYSCSAEGWRDATELRGVKAAVQQLSVYLLIHTNLTEREEAEGPPQD